MEPVTPATTIFVTTIGDEANFADCMAHLRSQTVERPIEIINRVAPMSAALQQMHARCRTPYYVQVDEDMILFPEAIATLERLIRESPPQVALACATLWDCDTERSIYGVKIYRHAIVRQFPYENTLSCEVRQLDRIYAAGFTALLLPFGDRSTCLGEHGKHYTPETIFKRWQRMFQKRRESDNVAWIDPWARRLLDRYVATGEVLHLYALLGAVAGIAGERAPDREADWTQPNPALARLRPYFPIDE